MSRSLTVSPAIHKPLREIAYILFPIFSDRLALHEEIRGGGSLLSRLDGETIKDSFLCGESKMLILVTGSGTLLLYKMENYQPTFYYKKQMDE